MRSRRLGTLLAFAILSGATHAAADASGDARIAQGLFDQARALMDAKRFAEACPKLAESQRLDPGGGTQLNLAVCHAGEGKVATALVEYHEALATATRDGRKDREAIIRSSIEALEQDVPHLTITVVQPTEGMVVTLDQTTMPRDAWGLPLPIDPGNHVLTTYAPDRPTTTVSFDIAVRDNKTIEARLAAPTPIPKAPTSKFIVRRSRANPIFVIAIVETAIAGAITIGAAGYAGIAKLESDGGCLPDRNYCRDDDSRNWHTTARTFAWISTGALIATGVGVVTLIVAPSRLRDSRRTNPSTSVGWYGLGGSF